METILPVLASLVTAIPIALVELALLVMAVSRRKRHPRVSMLAGTSAALMFLLDVPGRGLLTVLPTKLLESGSNTAAAASLYGSIELAYFSLYAVALGLLSAAAFIGRAQSAPS
jgi:hypothetical protein